MKLIDYLNKEIKVPRVAYLNYSLYFWISLGISLIEVIKEL